MKIHKISKKGKRAMSIEANKAIARRLAEEVQNQQNLAAMDELYAPNYVYHAAHGVPPTLEGNKQFFKMLFAAFPDLQLTIHDQIAEGDKVVTRKTMAGTHQGAFVGIPATGKRMTQEILEILQIEDGKIVGNWMFYDRLGLMYQLGVLPLPGR
jgi:steroid delta-isomerase-like uncharacterized protein